jgi:hypothetical protein
VIKMAPPMAGMLGFWLLIWMTYMIWSFEFVCIDIVQKYSTLHIVYTTITWFKISDSQSRRYSYMSGNREAMTYNFPGYIHVVWVKL